jgi:hypothetical protein
VRRAFAWVLTLVLATAGTLTAHAIAYTLTGEPTGDVHAYLAHAPQLLLVLGTLVVGALALTRGVSAPPAWPFPFLALGAYAAQEHVERIAHTGELPWLFTEPVFLLGLALQLPVALAAWALARRLLRLLAVASPRRMLLPAYLLAVVAPAGAPHAARSFVAAHARGPPVLLQAQ